MTEYAIKTKQSHLSAREYSEVIHECCRESCRRILDDFKAPYPTIYDLIHRFENSSNLLSSEQLHEILGGVRLPEMISDRYELFQLIYDIGFLGVVKDQEHIRELGLSPPYTTAHGKTYYFVFSHLHPRFSIVQEKQFVIHPSFYSRFNFKINSDITVAQYANFARIYQDG